MNEWRTATFVNFLPTFFTSTFCIAHSAIAAFLVIIFYLTANYLLTTFDYKEGQALTFFPLTTPGESASTMKPLRALCGGVLESSAVRASTKYQSATPPFVIHIFCPLSMYSSPLRTAFVRIPATSDPAPGSVTQYACTQLFNCSRPVINFNGVNHAIHYVM